MPERTRSADTGAANAAGPSFARRLLRWYDRHGRKDLPWQRDINPYRVWLSEVMLQQTQVATVIPYYRRFTERYPDVHSLAAAGDDEVMHHWSGLGYYSRARNLHRAAKIITGELGGAFPRDVAGWQELPGVGRSTAAAICSISYGSADAILDGNVKRVLARHFAVPGWPGKSSVSAELWSLAERCTPATRNRDYTQAIMDLGATLCVRGTPECTRCPLASSCIAHTQGSVADYPGRKPRRELPVRQTRLLLVDNARGELLMCKRPPAGIWGGLWSLPDADMLAGKIKVRERGAWPLLQHRFTHFQLDITPVHCELQHSDASMESLQWLWYNCDDPPDIGLPAPIQKLLQQFIEHKAHDSIQRSRVQQARVHEARAIEAKDAQEQSNMNRTVHCRKYQAELEGLAAPPFPGPKGKEIYDTVSRRAWEEWQKHQTMLINEKHLNMRDADARKFLQQEMEKFLSGEEFEQAEGFVPVEPVEAPSATENSGEGSAKH